VHMSTHGWDVSSAKNNNGEEFVLIVQLSLLLFFASFVNMVNRF
jgi:hypothetical protein